jgi:hypothetical protein
LVETPQAARLLPEIGREERTLAIPNPVMAPDSKGAALSS